MVNDRVYVISENDNQKLLLQICENFEYVADEIKAFEIFQITFEENLWNWKKQ